MNKYFNESHEWTENDINFTGLPRPFKVFDKKYYSNINVKLTKKFPIPWQSKPVFFNSQDKVIFNVIEENESRVIQESLCGYCGIKIENDEYCTRWNADDKYIPNKTGDRVKSDYSPLHLECMKQARIFCPFMRTVPEKEFQYDIFEQLKKNTNYYIKYVLKELGI